MRAADSYSNSFVFSAEQAQSHRLRETTIPWAVAGEELQLLRRVRLESGWLTDCPTNGYCHPRGHAYRKSTPNQSADQIIIKPFPNRILRDQTSRVLPNQPCRQCFTVGNKSRCLRKFQTWLKIKHLIVYQVPLLHWSHYLGCDWSSTATAQPPDPIGWDGANNRVLHVLTMARFILEATEQGCASIKSITKSLRAEETAAA